MGKNFDAVPEGTIFEANKCKYRKIDRLYYHELSEPDMERMINPIFDQTIGEKVAKPEDMDSTAKFIVDANTRIMRPNPNYDTSLEIKNAALLAFDEFYNTGYFVCEPRDVATMSEVILQMLLIETVPEPGNVDADNKTAKARAQRLARAAEKKSTEKKVAKKSAAKKSVAKKQNTKYPSKKGKK